MKGSFLVFPNPFTEKATIKYQMVNAGSVTISLYDSFGRLVTALVDEENTEEGSHSLSWTPDGLSQGLYFIRIKTNEYNVCKGILYVE
jgi:hypothetical protein